MIALLGESLKFLSTYGLIDMFFGIGIIAVIQRRLRRRPVGGIDGIEIMPALNAREGLLRIRIKNNSQEPLYLYRARLKQGYFIDELDSSSLKVWIYTTMFMRWSDKDLPRATEPRTTQGDYLLQALDSEGKDAETLFLEPRMEGSYVLGFAPADPAHSAREDAWNHLLAERHVGKFIAHYGHGVSAGQIQIQI